MGVTADEGDRSCPWPLPPGSSFYLSRFFQVSAINAFRERNTVDLVVHTQDSHPANHCSFHENHPGTEV